MPLIVKPNVSIVEPFEPLAVRLERAARICTGSESRTSTTADGALRFLERLWKRGHGSVFEHATLHYSLPCDPDDELVRRFKNTEPRYIVSTAAKGRLWLSGSPRAFAEHWLANPHEFVTCAVTAKVRTVLPFLPGPPPDDHLLDLTERTPGDVENVLPVSFPKHVRPQLRVTCSRIVSHELVRHRPASFLQRSQRYTREVQFIDPEGMPTLNAEDFDYEVLNALKTYNRWLELGARPEEARRFLPGCTATELIVTTSLGHWLGILRLRDSPTCDPEMQTIARQIRELLNLKYPEVVTR